MSEPTNREVAVLNAALELRPAERAAYLDEACAGDAALRRQVEDLLRAHAAAEGFLEAPPAGLSFSRTVRLTAPLTEKPGDRIGHYKLLQQIGEGGCGVVYMAEQEAPVRRRVALKVIKLGMDTKAVVARFEAERQALALMDHPNIAKVLEAGATETGRPYFVMELVRGIKITDFCDEHKLSTRERLKLFVQVCQAIQHAHQKGIIHRDIKPSNILVTINDPGSPGVPKVIDFGIAKATQGRLTDQTLFTAFEQFIGTPAYMSPEQAVMTSLDIDTRTDIYSLGVLLYELLTCRTPFDQQELLAAGLDEMRRTIREKEPLKPSTRLTQELVAADKVGRGAPRAPSSGENTSVGSAHGATRPTSQLSTLNPQRLKELIPLLRGDLDWIVMKCLEKDRARRYESAAGVAMDITRHLNCEPVIARPPSRLYEFQKTVRRHKFGFAAGAALITVLAVGALVSTSEAIRATRAEREQSHMLDQAKAQGLAYRQKAYASDMNLVQRALTVKNLGRAQELLYRQRPQPGQQDLRGWEWRYLWQQCRNGSLFTLCVRSNEICSLAVSFDGKWLAVGEHDHGVLSIWDLGTRRELTRWTAGDGYVFVAFSPRAPLLAFSVVIGVGTSNRRDSVRLWDGSGKGLLAELPLDGDCRGVAFSGDGQTLITSTHSEIALWRVADGKKMAGYKAEHDYVTDVPLLAVAQNLNLAAHGTREGHIRVVDLATGKERWRAEPGDEHVLTMAFSPDGKILASGAGFVESAIRLWDVAYGKEIGRLEGHRGYVQSLLFWPDGKTLASASSDQTIRLWDLANLTHVPPSRTLLGHKREVRRLALLPDSTRLVSACQDGSVYVWDTSANLSTPSAIKVPTIFTTLDRAWSFAPDGKSILNVDVRGRLVQWQGPEFQKMVPLLDLGAKVHGARISDDGRWLAAGSTDGIIRVWDLPNRTLLHEFTLSSGAVGPVQILDRGRRLLIHCQASKELQEWDLTTRRVMRTWRGVLFYNWNAGYSQDGRWFFLADTSNAASLSDVLANPLRTRNLDITQVPGVDLSPDGKLVAAASQSGFARLWETETLREIATFTDFLQGVSSVAFSRDGKRLATGSDGKEALKLWDVESHEELLTLEGQGSRFFSISFSRDGTLLGALNSLGVLQIWRAPSMGEIVAAELAR